MALFAIDASWSHTKSVLLVVIIVCTVSHLLRLGSSSFGSSGSSSATSGGAAAGKLNMYRLGAGRRVSNLAAKCPDSIAYYCRSSADVFNLITGLAP